MQNPPNKVDQQGTDPTAHLTYRKSPFIIQAACAGEIKSIGHLIAAGLNFDEVGHICLTKRRQNTVKSNVIGAAAYHGHDEMLRCLLDTVHGGILEAKSIEKADRIDGKTGDFKPDGMSNLTPLQLAIVSPHLNTVVFKTLLNAGANQFVLESGTNNTIIHLAAKHCTNVGVFQYIINNTEVEIFARNSEGDTALTICQQLNNLAA